MNCSQVETLIEDYYDGELDPKRIADLEAHLASCVNCSRRLESLRSEGRLYDEYGQSLDRSLEIKASMWDGIRRELVTETRALEPLHKRHFAASFGIFSRILPASWIGRQFVLASLLVMLSVCGTLLVVRYHQKDAVTVGKSVSRPAPGSQPRDLQSALLSIRKAEQEYIGAIETLSGIVDKKKESLDPALAAELKKNLEAVDAAIASSRKAYHAHPADPELARYMLKAYQKKVELLQDLALNIT